MQSTNHTIQQGQNQSEAFDFDKPALIVGIGKTGVSCARFLKKNNTPFSIADNRLNPPLLDSVIEEFGNINLLTGAFRLESFLPYQQFIVSPGISIREELFLQLQQQGRLIIGDIELFAQVVDKPVIAITGSNGKTTVTTLVETIARAGGINAVAGGNLGLPALDLLAMDCELYILELSSFQLETTKSLKTISACVLNITEDHMDRYNDINDYRHVKETIYKHCEYKVINKEEHEIVAKYLGDKVILFGTESANDDEYGISVKNGSYCLTKGSKILLKDDEILLKGQFNYLNILAAIALLEAFHIDEQKLLTAIKKFKGLAHRCEWTTEINGVDFYNDSKGTNTGATISAINSFSRPEILIAGGVGKDANFSELGILIRKKIKAAVLIGIDANLIKSAAESAGTKPDVIYLVNTMHEAVKTAFQLSDSGDVILFSPACASFDMYTDYIQRGKDFTHQVLGLKQHWLNKEEGLNKAPINIQTKNHQTDNSQTVKDQGRYKNAF